MKTINVTFEAVPSDGTCHAEEDGKPCIFYDESIGCKRGFIPEFDLGNFNCFELAPFIWKIKEIVKKE